MKPVILWADDEIELLKPHIMFLTAKGYEMVTVKSGADALACVVEREVDVVILDEHMPGITGLEALSRIKLTAPHLPVIMITKSEEEDIMDQAIGGKIADYLIKPVNPNQILLSIKKVLDAGRLVAERNTDSYREDFARISLMTGQCSDLADWAELHRRLVHWQMELESPSPMASMLESQTNEANAAFAKYIRSRYPSLIAATGEEAPLMSHNLVRRRLFPLVEQGARPWMIVVDNFRLDQWLAIKPLLADRFTFAREEACCSILPTATQYARNAIFAGMMPADIRKHYPTLWLEEDSPESKNLNEEQLMAAQLKRFRRDWRFSYTKINDSEACAQIADRLAEYASNDFNVVVLNFIDMLSHARSESHAVRELASSDAAYRSITASWFRHSPALRLFEAIAATGAPILLTTDHGTVRVDTPRRVVGDRNTSTALRYKVGKNLDYEARRVIEVRRPADFGLPAPNLSSAYIFAIGRDFFVYPNNYNQYVQRYDGTYQHGGVSLEEMLVPAVTLRPKENRL